MGCNLMPQPILSCVDINTCIIICLLTIIQVLEFEMIVLACFRPKTKKKISFQITNKLCSKVCYKKNKYVRLAFIL